MSVESSVESAWSKYGPSFVCGVVSGLVVALCLWLGTSVRINISVDKSPTCPEPCCPVVDPVPPAPKPKPVCKCKPPCKCRLRPGVGASTDCGCTECECLPVK